MEIKKPLQLYKSIDKYNISSLIPIYTEKNIFSDFEKKQINLFSNVRIFGDLTSPMYSLKDVAIVLGIKKPLSATNNFRDNEIEKAMIISEETGKKLSTFLLTQKGLLRLILTTNNDTGELLLTCFRFILNSLFIKKYVTLDNVTSFVESKHMDLYKKVIYNYKKNCRMLKHKNHKLLNRIEFMIDREKNTEQELKQTCFSLESAIIDKIESEQKLKLIERDYDKLEAEMNVDPYFIENMETKFLLEKHNKVVHIYLENITPIFKNNSNIQCRDSFLAKLGIDDYNIDNYNINIPPDNDDSKLYSILKGKSKRKSRVLVYTIFGPNKHTFNNLKIIMEESYSNNFLKNYKETSSEIILICSIDDIILEYNDIKIKYFNLKDFHIAN